MYEFSFQRMDHLHALLWKKVEDLAFGLFLPLYIVSSGLKTNIAIIQGLQSWGLLVLFIFTTCFGVSLNCKAPLREVVTLGFLMNTKSLVELIVLNICKDRRVISVFLQSMVRIQIPNFRFLPAITVQETFHQ